MFAYIPLSKPPRYLGYQELVSYSPEMGPTFSHYVALKVVSIPTERQKDRQWQVL
jgi:hypothetical protein